MVGVGLYIEENAQEILGRFSELVSHQLGFEDPSLKLAAPVLLQDLARAMLRGDSAVREPWKRSMLLVVSQPAGGIRGLIREFALLRFCLWSTLTLRRHAITADERRRVDLMLDEALGYAAERWASLARLLPAPRAPAEAPVRPLSPPAKAGVQPPPLPSRRPEAQRPAGPAPARPPPLPGARRMPPGTKNGQTIH